METKLSTDLQTCVVHVKTVEEFYEFSTMLGGETTHPTMLALYNTINLLLLSVSFCPSYPLTFHPPRAKCFLALGPPF